MGEFIADKLLRTGKRTDAGPLIAGGLCGVAICVAADQSFEFRAALGAGGAIVGCVAGYYLRTSLVRRIGTADMFIAVPEDLLAIGLSILTVLSLGNTSSATGARRVQSSAGMRPICLPE